MRALLQCKVLLQHSPSSVTRCPFFFFFFHSRTRTGGSAMEESLKRRGYSRSEEEIRSVMVSVWWDFENCSVPAGVNVFKVAQRITQALRVSGIKGPVNITAFGDIFQLSRASQEALSSTGICLSHVPRSGKNSADRSIMIDLALWVSQNPPPAHLFLISGDGDFSNILHRLRMNNYNILLASTECSPVLCSAASIMWQWSGLVRGHSLMGKYFNHPPDGMYNSWYGHYKGPIEEVFMDIKLPISDGCSPEDCPESSMDPKPRPIPKAVVSRIHKIVNSFPQGVSVPELRTELSKNNVPIDKDFFGYKKFTRFLLAMQNILKIKRAPSGEAKLLVYGLEPKLYEPVKPDSINGHLDTTIPAASTKSNEGSQPVGPQPDSKEPVLHNQETPATDISHSSSVDELGSSVKEGFLQRIKRLWYGNGSDHHNVTLVGIAQVGYAEIESCSKMAATNVGSCKYSESKMTSTVNPSPSREPHDCANSSSHLLDVSKATPKEESTGCVGKTDEKSYGSQGFFAQLLRGWKLWGIGKESLDNTSPFIDQNPKTHYTEKYEAENLDVNVVQGQSINHESFSRDDFWDAMKSFLQSPKGLKVVSKSKTREQMVKKLQKEESLKLDTLLDCHLQRLAEILIHEKKWVEECAFDVSPFKVTLPTENGFSSSSSNFDSPVLSTIFLAGASNSLNGFSREEKNPPKLSRSKIIEDCQAFLTDVLKYHPEGFNIGSIRPQFYARYGYILDYKTLGYPKLTSLLEIMPGVKIESYRIIPGVDALSDKDRGKNVRREELLDEFKSVCSPDKNAYLGEKADRSETVTDQDCVWEELGPVTISDASENAEDSTLNAKTDPEIENMNPYQTYSLSDIELSDSESESSLENEANREEMERNKDDGSLLRILDSWHEKKERVNKDCPEALDGLVECSQRNQSEPLASSTLSPKSSSRTLKPKSRKNYSFVTESVDDEKEKLIDSILGTLKKSSNSNLGS
ncbi:uncharacterized protein LOC18441213 [Amborella trichopoda]|nr:uncharacterized protein LOC18441213 [Amborella trichopoda]|eukprot:XP_006851397.3 uncharacterized protein LOC18441213 [Amborella trichopoda]